MSEAMKIGVIGTGVVGQSLAARLAELGHSVVVGTRDPKETLARDKPDGFGNPPFHVWLASHPSIRLVTMQEAGAHGAMLVNATSGVGALAALELVGKSQLHGKILIDISNPLDFSRGFPPSLSVCNTDSLGEQIQRAFPDTRVVKTLNTMNAFLMVKPALLEDADHTVFLSGNDDPAKATVTELLQSFGWKHILDLGDITTARGTEMLLPIWVRIWSKTKNPMFSLKVVLGH